MLKNSFYFVLVYILFCVGCNNINLAGLAPAKVNSTSVGSFCTYDPNDKISYTNYLFIIDVSGSNADTDPSKIRMQKTVDFYNAHKTDPYTRWGGIMFDSDAKAAIYDTSDKNPIFTDDQGLVSAGMARFQAAPNGSGTNYSQAIQLGQSAITADIAQHTDRQDTYMVFFLTDGQPNEGVTSTAGLVGVVQSLIGVKPGQIFFSAAYYGGQGTPSMLQAMAQAGGGKFQNLNNAGGLDFGGLIAGPTIEPWVLKKDSFLVYNLNTAICETGKNKGNFGVDSDGDGVCDDDELFYGTDPHKRSTPWPDPKTGVLTDDGYGDYFHILQKQGLITLPNCPADKRTDVDQDLLNDCEEGLLHNDTPSGTTLGSTVWKTGDTLDPDTDNDGIIDGLEVYLFRTHLGWAMDDRVDKAWSGENISALKKVQQHKNPLLPDTSPAYDTVVTPIGTSGGKTCYTFSQTKLALYHTLNISNADVHPMLARGNNQNVILMYYMQNKFNDPNGKGIYMHSVQALDVDANYQNGIGTAAGLQVNDSVFTPYSTYLNVNSN